MHIESVHTINIIIVVNCPGFHIHIVAELPVANVLFSNLNDYLRSSDV